MKLERLHRQRFLTRRQARDEAIAWLLWYNQTRWPASTILSTKVIVANRTRLHSTLAYVSPVRFEQDWLAAQARQANS